MSSQFWINQQVREVKEQKGDQECDGEVSRGQKAQDLTEQSKESGSFEENSMQGRDTIKRCLQLLCKLEHKQLGSGTTVAPCGKDDGGVNHGG